MRVVLSGRCVQTCRHLQIYDAIRYDTSLVSNKNWIIVFCLLSIICKEDNMLDKHG